MRTKRLIEELIHRVDLIDRSLVVMNPDTPRSVEAYDGLRKQVAAAAKSRQLHTAHLAQMYRLLADGGEPEVALAKVREFMEQADLGFVDDPRHREAFDVLGGQGAEIEVLSPAVVDRETGILISRGTARAVSSAGAESDLEEGFDGDQGDDTDVEDDAAISDANAAERTEQ